MSLAAHLTSANTSGLFELRNDGTVIYSRFRKNNRLINPGSKLVGANFFDDIAGFENTKDFRRLFNNFVKSNKFTDNFLFECRFAGQIVSVRVMLVRAFENNYPNPSDIIILDIRNGVY